MNGIFKIDVPVNEQTLQYAPNSKEKELLILALSEAKSHQADVPMYIGGQKIYTQNKKRMSCPHEHSHTLGFYNEGTPLHASQAISAALEAKKSWEIMPWEQRSSIFLKAADLLSTTYRYKINAGTMLCQSKSAYQAEIDAACESIDFLRYNVFFANEIYKIQPNSSFGVWNRMEYRPLEGFVYALTPFNFTAIAANLPIAPALMGNTIVWKPSEQQVYTAQIIMEILIEAGLPKGVINLIYGDGVTIGEEVFGNKDFAGIHFTGSTSVFKKIWKKIGNNIDKYKSYPKIVGETGGKDFILAHKSADVKILTTALIRGAFEYQGQKCSACSRAYISKSIWNQTWIELENELKTIKIGSTEDFTCFMNAVIDENSFDKIVNYIEKAKKVEGNKVLFGGKYDKSKGYFIDPTVILTQNPHSITMEEEIFGPVLTIFLFDDTEFEQTLTLIDTTSIYALTGAIIAQDKEIQQEVTLKLRNAAGNIYMNDKCTGAVVGQQPFGGARMSGTNDKSGSMLNLLRWVSPRTIKENHVPSKNYRYPFLESN